MYEADLRDEADLMEAQPPQAPPPRYAADIPDRGWRKEISIPREFPASLLPYYIVTQLLHLVHILLNRYAVKQVVRSCRLSYPYRFEILTRPVL